MNAIIEMDLHGMTAEEAYEAVSRMIRKADSGVYRIRLIHGYHRGNALKRMAEEEFAYGREPKVKRVEGGINPGITELILREY